MIKSVLVVAGLSLGFATPALACTDISSKTVKLTGCVDEQWVPGKPSSDAQEFPYATADGNFGMQVITQTDAVSAQAFHDSIIGNAAAAINGKPEDIKVISEHIENVDGKPFNVLEYSIPNDGNPIIFQNYYYSQPGFGSVQLLGYSLEADAAAAGFKLGAFAATLKVGS